MAELSPHAGGRHRNLAIDAKCVIRAEFSFERKYARMRDVDGGKCQMPDVKSVTAMRRSEVRDMQIELLWQFGKLLDRSRDIDLDTPIPVVKREIGANENEMFHESRA